MQLAKETTTDASRADFLSALSKAFLQSLEPLIEDCCQRIDSEFAMQISKNKAKPEKAQYSKLLLYLRTIRLDIKQNYLSQLTVTFAPKTKSVLNPLNLAAISLADDERLAEEYAINSLTRQTENTLHEELFKVNKLWQEQGVQYGWGGKQNPWAPAKLIQALVDVLQGFKLNTASRIAVYQSFGDHVFSQLAFVYQDLARHIQIESELRSKPALLTEFSVKPMQESPETFSNWVLQLQQWRNSNAVPVYASIAIPETPVYEVFELENALQVLKQMCSQTPLKQRDFTQPLKLQVVHKLKQLDYSEQCRCLSQHDEDVLDWVSLMFDAIANEPLISEALKPLLLQLEIPVAALGLALINDLDQVWGSVGQLLDSLVSASRFLTEGVESDQREIAQIKRCIAAFNTTDALKLGFWQEQEQIFSAESSKNRLLADVLEKQLRSDCAVNEQGLKQQADIAEIIQHKLQDIILPSAVISFLQNVWLLVLSEDFKHKEIQHGHWETSLQTMDDLIASVLPPGDENEKKRVLNLLPQLVKSLRHGLKRIGYDKTAQSRFFKELAVLHIMLLDKKNVPVASQQVKLTSTQPCYPNLTQQELGLVGALAIPTWLMLHSESNAQWGKLVWQSKLSNTVLLVTKSGIKLLEMRLDAFNAKLAQGQFSVVRLDNVSIIKQVLDTLKR
ncbi:MAG: DUF1631 family protein [Methylococcaceae bacterium]|jgi:hypothetical protein